MGQWRPATFARTQNMRPRFFIQPVLNKTGPTTVRHNPGTKNPLLPPQNKNYLPNGIFLVWLLGKTFAEINAETAPKFSKGAGVCTQKT